MIIETEEIVNNLKVHFRLCGDPANRPLVFLSAWGAHFGKFKLVNATDIVIENFASHFYIISIEHPGLMRSEIPPVGYQFKDYAETVSTVLSSLNVEKVIILGNSYGGAIATAFAKLFPQKVERLILVDSVVSKDFEQTKYVFENNKKLYLRLKSKHGTNVLKKFITWFYLGVPFDYLKNEDSEKRAAMVKWAGKRDLDVDYSELKVPVLLLWGKNDLKIHPINYAREIAKRLKNGKLVEYGGNVGTIYKKPGMIKKLILENL